MTITEWLTARGRTRFHVADDPPPDVRDQVEALVNQHRTRLGLPTVDLTLTAKMANDALDWHETREEH